VVECGHLTRIRFESHDAVGIGRDHPDGLAVEHGARKGEDVFVKTPGPLAVSRHHRPYGERVRRDGATEAISVLVEYGRRNPVCNLFVVKGHEGFALNAREA